MIYIYKMSGSDDDVREIWLSPYHFDDAQLYPGPKYVLIPRHRGRGQQQQQQCCSGGIKVKWDELQVFLATNGMREAPCPQCQKRIDYSNLVGSIAPNYKTCYCDKLCLIRTAKKTGKPYASCMTRMGRDERCDYFSFFS
jgi:hypothetical protein